jgi:hypothetical protein
MLIKEYLLKVRAAVRGSRNALDQAVAYRLEALAEDCERLSKSRILIRLVPLPCGLARQESAES